MLKENELEAFFNWIVDIIGHDEWQKRKSAIDAFLDDYYNFKDRPLKLHSKGSILYEADIFAWYLYLTEARLFHILDYDYEQGARILPFFETFAFQLDLLKSINGIEEVIRRISYDQKEHPDGGIFEIAVALAYMRNGCDNVSFASTSDVKTHDLDVEANCIEWAIECKQKFSKSDYLKEEKEKWLKMWNLLANSLVGNKYEVILDIVFHKELNCFPDDFLEQQIVYKLKFVDTATDIIDNEDFTVKVDFVDKEKIKKDLKDRDVMITQFDLAELIAGKYDSIREYSPVFMGKSAKNRRAWIEDINYCACAIWNCDDENAYINKAKSLKGQLNKAIKQLPDNKPGIVHVGFESHSGGKVENQRYMNIMNEIQGVNVGKKDLQWIYCHVFNPKIPPSLDCDVMEACYFSSWENSLNTPLAEPNLLLPEKSERSEQVDWEQFNI